jgi:hypothetical protein
MMVNAVKPSAVLWIQKDPETVENYRKKAEDTSRQVAEETFI